MKHEITKPILRWPGGKTRMLKRLLPKITPHVCYCEPFAGGLAVLFAKPRSTVEVVNDINGDLIALYLNAQRHLPELLRQIESFFNSRQLLRLANAQRGFTEIERGARFLLRNRLIFGGSFNGFRVSKTRGGGGGFSREKVKELLRAAHERLDNVAIENVPYDRCFKLYDSAETFFFIDPPYLDANPGGYAGWDRKQLKEFREHLRGLKGNWVVTLDDSAFNRDLFSDCPMEAVETANKCVNHNVSGNPKFGELIISKP
jgi:DNA adenine methylase